MVHSKSLQTTIEAYEHGVSKYKDGTPMKVGEEYRPFLNALVEQLPDGARILEIGSATGRDAAYLEQRGLRVQRSDVVNAFVEYLKDRWIQIIAQK